MSVEVEVLPSVSEIAEAQNETKNLRLLIAQRRIYSQAKTWSNLRIVGIVLIAIAAPFIAFFFEEYAIWIGASSALWIFLSQSFFLRFENRLKSRAACIQEKFDTQVFQIEALLERPDLPTSEEITKFAPKKSDVMSQAETDKLFDWYALDKKTDSMTAIALCQRTNCSYSHALLNTTSKVVFIAAVAWAVLLVSISAATGLDLATFILAIFFPLLPSFLEALKFSQDFQHASAERKSMTNVIEKKVKNNSVRLADLIKWQANLYDLRTDTPLVPDFIYRFKRDENEAAMESTVKQLSRKR